MTPTLATPANMRAFSEANPGRSIETPDGPAYIMGRTCCAFSPITGETASATAGDYFMMPDAEPLRDSEGEPMVLAISRTVYLDALTGEPIA